MNAACVTAGSPSCPSSGRRSRVEDALRSTAPPANDAMLVQLVRGALGRQLRAGVRSKINVSSCAFVITLHGSVEGEEEAAGIEARVRAVPGVRDVINHLNTG